jgi:hypothetical protein
MFPQARTNQLTICELPEETLVYDKQRHKGHCLNATAALVWRHCDGHTPLDELARIVTSETGITPAGDVVALALEQLGRRHLLNEAPRPPAVDRISRREVLRNLALAAAALPLVMTIATKAAAQSISDPDPPSVSDPSPVTVSVPVTVQVQHSAPATPSPPAAVPCRQRGQSCLATTSGQQGTCCAGLKCNGVLQGAGVCG